MTSPDTKSVTIEHAEADGRGAFFVQREGVHLAEMTYSRAGSRAVFERGVQPGRPAAGHRR